MMSPFRSPGFNFRSLQTNSPEGRPARSAKRQLRLDEEEDDKEALDLGLGEPPKSDRRLICTEELERDLCSDLSNSQWNGFVPQVSPSQAPVSSSQPQVSQSHPICTQVFDTSVKQQPRQRRGAKAVQESQSFTVQPSSLSAPPQERLQLQSTFGATIKFGEGKFSDSLKQINRKINGGLSETPASTTNTTEMKSVGRVAFQNKENMTQSYNINCFPLSQLYSRTHI
eukprot:TRINITY_DN1724_c0_g1_i16.p2 TRINITY_DN1724_c0_g1~~TRINITY_DN1724_c0_g1_i16.p2  ORF type:complete len:227 (-),score=49.98 TRINITY_DN1724_c0_g1_i16:259-939(-)